MATIERAFVDIAEGQIHLRRTKTISDATPLIILHPSPTSSISLVPLMEQLGALSDRPIICLDTMGNGDSVAPAEDAPDIATFADASLRAIAALGIQKFHLFGMLTGSRMACEMALINPHTIETLIFEGAGEFDADMQKLLLAEYAPEMTPHDYGYQLTWAFNFVRDQATHFPYFLRDPDHRLMTRAVPDAEELHMRAVEVLKALKSYHKSYRAAFAYPMRSRLEQLQIPAYFLAPQGQDAAIADQSNYAQLVKDGEVKLFGPNLSDKAGCLLQLVGE